MVSKKNKRPSIKNLQRFLQKGQVSRLLLVLAIIVLVAVVIVYLVMRMAEKPAAPSGPEIPEVPQPFYETTLGDIRFVFISARNLGNVLRVSDIKNTQYSYAQKDFTTTEKFIEVTIGAQNKGTENIVQNAWKIGDIVDSELRRFVPVEGYSVQPWMPTINPCGALLKPAFDPTPCTQIYEVSKQSSGLKVEVKTGTDNSANNLSSGNADSFLLDLIVR